MSKDYVLTSESVSEGHPDKVADRISDTILDAHLEREPRSRVACETLVTEDFVCIAGEIRSDAPLARAEIEDLVREVVRDIGYTEAGDGFSAETLALDIRLHAQASEIAEAVDRTSGRSQGAGDQGMMFGYATDETTELMPAPITWAHGLTRKLAMLRKSAEVEWLRPDAKSQVSVRYVDGVPREITGIVVSTQHAESASTGKVREFIVDGVVPEVIDDDFLIGDWQDEVFVNPSGSFVRGGPAADTGLTGRKIIVDTYGGAARHGGGAFSGKDPSKVDRSGAYGARWAAKNVVGTGLASRCEVAVAYAIGVADPVAVAVETFGTAEDEDAIEKWIRDRFDLSPGGIIEDLDLLRPIYATTTAYGHFGRAPGRNGEFPWERLLT